MEIDPTKSYANIIKTSKGYCVDTLTESIDNYPDLKGMYFGSFFEALEDIHALGLELACFVC